MTLEEAKQKCEQAGQQHLLAYYDELTKEDQEKLLSQIEKMDITLLDLLKKENKEVEKGKLEPLGAVTLEEIQKEKEGYRKIGCEAIRTGKVGAVLLAGGQGTRLGLDKPKGMLNVGVHKELYLFEQLIHNIMDVVKETGAWVPLFIMTSEKNNKDTVEFFKEKKFFGYKEDYVYFFVQHRRSVTTERFIWKTKDGFRLHQMEMADGLSRWCVPAFWTRLKNLAWNGLMYFPWTMCCRRSRIRYLSELF